MHFKEAICSPEPGKGFLAQYDNKPETEDNLQVLKSSKLVADRVSEFPLEFISLHLL